MVPIELDLMDRLVTGYGLTRKGTEHGGYSTREPGSFAQVQQSLCGRFHKAPYAFFFVAFLMAGLPFDAAAFFAW
jgi:hypothetical protein